MRFVLKHPFLLFFVLAMGVLMTLTLWPTRATKEALQPVRAAMPNVSILVTEIPETGLINIFVQHLDPATGSLVSQEVFTMEGRDARRTIVNYTSTAPDFLTPAMISQQPWNGKILPPETQANLQTWLRAQWYARLNQLNLALHQKTKLSLFAAMKVVQEGTFLSASKQQEILPWVVLPAKPSGEGGSPNVTPPREMQAQLLLEAAVFESLKTFCKRLTSEFQRRISPSK